MPYRKPYKLEEFDRNKVQELLNKGIFENSSSPWSMETVLVHKGHKGAKGAKCEPRFCIDYRPLNRQTEKNSYLLPNIQTVLDWVGHNFHYVLLLDANKGFWSLSF